MQIREILQSQNLNETDIDKKGQGKYGFVLRFVLIDK